MVVKTEVTMVVIERLEPRLTMVVGIDETIGDGVGDCATLFEAEPEPDAGCCEPEPDDAGGGADDEAGG